jgi:hypothetical protein
MVAAIPTGTVRGERLETTGLGLFTVSVPALAVPPPGDGLVTVTISEALPETSLAGSAAFSSVPLTNVVTSAVPFQFTTDAITNPLPVTSSVKGPDPATTLAGLTVLTTGLGLLTVNDNGPDVPPPGAGLLTLISPTLPV